MIIIYDFDGTLTPYGWPQYGILKKNGYNAQTFASITLEKAKKEKITLQEAFFKLLLDLPENTERGISEKDILYGSSDVIFNPGVLDFFEKIATNQNGVKNYIVTSGIKEYVANTKVAKYVSKIYGTELKIENGYLKGVEFILNDDQKPSAIKQIVQNNSNEPLIYIGDGLTDIEAFKYTKSIGGTSIFVGSAKEDFSNYQTLSSEGYVDEYFNRDYSAGSKLRKYIEDKIKLA